jgi:hypothetical protein
MELILMLSNLLNRSKSGRGDEPQDGNLADVERRLSAIRGAQPDCTNCGKCSELKANLIPNVRFTDEQARLFMSQCNWACHEVLPFMHSDNILYVAQLLLNHGGFDHPDEPERL